MLRTIFRLLLPPPSLLLLSTGPRPAASAAPRAEHPLDAQILTSLHMRSEAEASPPGELTLTTTPSIWTRKREEECMRGDAAGTTRWDLQT